MSKRAEEVALKAYPNEMVTTCARGNKFLAGPLLRRGFQEGYEQAEKDTIERAIEWLKEYANGYIVDLTPTYPDAPVNIIVGGKCWEDLKKAMEE